jgi:hypothetical protein
MYDNIKSFIMHNNEKSDFFACMQGVRQGVPPFLFSIFLNDLEDYFEELNALPLGTITEKIQSTLHTIHNTILNIVIHIVNYSETLSFDTIIL